MHVKPARLSAQALLVLGCTLVNLHAQTATPDAAQATTQTQAGAPAGLATVEIVEFGSFETKGLFSPQPVMIRGHLLPATGTGRGAAAVLNPACEGLLAPGGQQVRGKYLRMARFLHSRGFTVLMIDGFNPRGYEEACSTNRIDHITRLKDALGGLAYLRGRSNVAADKVVAVTWGNTGGIEGMNKGMPYLQKADSGFMAAVMYYPECGKIGGYFSPTAPIQVFAGEKDEWNPPSLCAQLAKRQEPGSAPFLIKLYPDTYHSFDQPTGEPRPNPFNPSKGWVGRNASATADSYLAIDAFLSTLPGIPPRPERAAQP